jgi:hypothetical protein
MPVPTVRFSLWGRMGCKRVKRSHDARSEWRSRRHRRFERIHALDPWRCAESMEHDPRFG